MGSPAVRFVLSTTMFTQSNRSRKKLHFPVIFCFSPRDDFTFPLDCDLCKTPTPTSSTEFIRLSTPFKDLFKQKNSLLLVPKKMTAQKKWSFYNHFFCSFPTSKKNKGKRPEPRLLYISNCVEVGVPSTAIRKLQLFSKYCRSGYCIFRLMFKARTMTVVII